MRGTWRRVSILALLGVAAMAAILYGMGRAPICDCGVIRMWAGDVHAPDNSQQLADWYSFSHILHGFIFYALLRWALRGLRLPTRFLVAVALECGWEVLENSPVIIERYRQATIAIGYTGDSILNSVSDVAMMALGFYLAARLPWRWTVGLALVFELSTLAIIRDNLTLNVLMLAWPLESVRLWQAGA